MADAELRSFGVTKDTVHGTACYALDRANTERAIVGIDEFEPNAKGGLVGSLMAELLNIGPIWWLVPKFTYFGEKPWTNSQWAALGLPILRDEVLEWSREDLPTIDLILKAHCEFGWNTGWDLYLASPDGEFLAFIDHHEVLSVDVRHREHAEALSAALSSRGVSNQVYPERSDAEHAV